MSHICQAADRHLVQLVEWAKHIPHFTELPVDDQVILLKAGRSFVLDCLYLFEGCFFCVCVFVCVIVLLICLFTDLFV